MLVLIYFLSGSIFLFLFIIILSILFIGTCHCYFPMRIHPMSLLKVFLLHYCHLPPLPADVNRKVMVECIHSFWCTMPGKCWKCIVVGQILYAITSCVFHRWKFHRNSFQMQFNSLLMDLQELFYVSSITISKSPMETWFITILSENSWVNIYRK